MVRIQIESGSAAETDRYAGELESALQAEAPGVKIERTSDQTRTMDFGATLVLLLGAPAVTAIAHGIGAWLAKRPNASLKIDGQVVTFKGSSKDAATIAEALLRR